MSAKRNKFWFSDGLRYKIVGLVSEKEIYKSNVNLKKKSLLNMEKLCHTSHMELLRKKLHNLKILKLELYPLCWNTRGKLPPIKYVENFLFI